MEGISVFLSLFDDNPDVKRTFCPPKECYDLQANAFVTKPVDFNSFLAAVRRVDEFFLTVARLPPNPKS